MRRVIPHLSVVLIAVACTGPQTPPSEAPIPVSDRVQLSAEGTSMAHELYAHDETYTNSVPVAPDRAFTVLPAVFQNLGLTVTSVQPAERYVKGEVRRTRRPFGGKSLAQLLDCGSTAAGPTAARYAINLTITTRAIPVTAGATDVATVVQAVAEPSGTAGNNVRCRPSPAFAQIIADQVRQAAIAR